MLSLSTHEKQKTSESPAFGEHKSMSMPALAPPGFSLDATASDANTGLSGPGDAAASDDKFTPQASENPAQASSQTPFQLKVDSNPTSEPRENFQLASAHSTGNQTNGQTGGDNPQTCGEKGNLRMELSRKDLKGQKELPPKGCKWVFKDLGVKLNAQKQKSFIWRLADNSNGKNTSHFIYHMPRELLSNDYSPNKVLSKLLVRKYKKMTKSQNWSIMPNRGTGANVVSVAVPPGEKWVVMIQGWHIKGEATLTQVTKCKGKKAGNNRGNEQTLLFNIEYYTVIGISKTFKYKANHKGKYKKYHPHPSKMMRMQGTKRMETEPYGFG